MKRFVIILVPVLAVVLIVLFLFVKGAVALPKLETVGTDETTETVIHSVEDLEEGCYYVWHNRENRKLQADLTGTSGIDAFVLCPKGTVNWDDDSPVPHTVWYSSREDQDIPTLYPGDVLLYISSTRVPFEGITWERFADYGYSIGVANMIGDESGHYRIPYDAEDGYAGYIDPESDAADLNQYQTVSELFLDKIGSVEVRDELVSDGGTVLGLERDKAYLCEWYTGTFYQDFKMSADIHVFGTLESFTTYDYEFLHSNCISITIPEWLKTGCYYLDGIGMFRYVTEADAALYSGEPYDASVDWNDPIILYDENGLLRYDPTLKGDEVPAEVPDSSIPNGSQGQTGTENSQTESVNAVEMDQSDGGAEEYEDLS